MPRPIRRRGRPLRRAVVTGAAYKVGKNKGQRQETAGGGAPDVARQPQGEHALTREQKLEQLKKLGELKSAGVLTEEEFQREKSKILE